MWCVLIIEMISKSLRLIFSLIWYNFTEEVYDLSFFQRMKNGITYKLLRILERIAGKNATQGKVLAPGVVLRVCVVLQRIVGQIGQTDVMVHLVAKVNTNAC